LEDGGVIEVVYIKEKKECLLAIIDELDIKAETSPLKSSESGKLREANVKPLKLRREEEFKWAQRAKVKHVGNNTKYFHLIANGKHGRKKKKS
jgi:hypothetical protein